MFCLAELSFLATGLLSAGVSDSVFVISSEVSGLELVVIEVLFSVIASIGFVASLGVSATKVTAPFVFLNFSIAWNEEKED